ncbi:MAG: hypothetical protein NXI12_08925 [Alphaproteobacteria bacterium]|nr:hypothetical protein [Alphaproteobacteria bacterium]
MKWLAALLAALAVLQAGAGVCANPAHAAGTDTMAGHGDLTQDEETACHGRMNAPETLATHATMDAPEDPAPDCCASGACADCALVVGALASADAATPGLAPMIKAARAPEAPLGRPLTHDPPPPRA